MKVTLKPNGDITFEADTAADALALLREMHGVEIQNGHVAQAEVVSDVEHDDDDEDAAEAVAGLDNSSSPVECVKRPDDASIKRAAAKAAGLSIQHYVVWEYLVDKDGSRGGVSIDHVMRKFHISRSAANQRLMILEKKGFATRVGRGQYRASTP
jgi:hypothetical protein